MFNACSIADFCLELEQEFILSLFEFFANVSSRLQYHIIPSSDLYEGDSINDSSSSVHSSENSISRSDSTLITPVFNGNSSKRIVSLPSIVPIGAPWQQIYLLARTQKKIYIELLDLAPIKLTLRSLDLRSVFIKIAVFKPLWFLFIPFLMQFFQCPMDASKSDPHIQRNYYPRKFYVVGV